MDKNTIEDLRNYIERVERLNNEKQTISDDIKDVYSEAKSRGYDVPTIKQIIKLRKKSNDQISKEEHLLDTYKLALGMISGE